MRYLRQQRVVKTICDEEITDKETIASLFEYLAKTDVSLFLSYTDEKSGHALNYDNVRVKSFKDGMIDIKVNHSNAVFGVSKIPIASISFVKLITDTNNVIISNEKITRYDLMDLGEDEVTK